MPEVIIERNKKVTIHEIVKIVVSIIIGILGGAGFALTVKPEEGKIIIEANTLELSGEQVEAIVGVEGSESIVEAPTVEIVDTNAILDDTTAQGAYFDTTDALSFYDAVGEGQCLNNSFGAQCFELANQFWWNYAGRGLNSCGTGAAKGAFNCDNAGQEFMVIEHADEIQAGDWVVFSGGQYGHIGQAIGRYNNGYVALFGQNQGGGKCSLGGSATNVINKSTKDFLGAFRPVSYIIPEPEPEPEPLPTNPDTGIVK